MKIKYLLTLLTVFGCLSLSAQNATKCPHVKVGMAGYTFHKFNLDTTLIMLNRVGVKYLCVKDFHLPINSDEKQIAEFHKKLSDKGITPYAVGPIYMKTEQAIDEAFAYAKRLGVKTVVAVPSYELLPYVDKKVKEYDMRVAIHLHGPDIDIFPNATDVWENVKDLDPRIGMCLDLGHDLRDGQNPVEDYIKYHTRVFDVHIKDVTAPTKQGVGIEMGRGLVNFPEFVKALHKYKYDGVCSLEYEKDMSDPLVGIAESIGYYNGVINSCCK